MDCSETRRLIHGYLDGELDLVRSLDLEEHLETCQSCARDYRNLQTMRTAIGSASLYFETPAALESRVRMAVRQAGKAQPERSQPRRVPWRWLSLVAALVSVFVVAFGLASLVSQPPAGADMEQEVLASHVRSLMPGHLTDVLSSDKHTVKPWFAGKLDFSPTVTDLAAQGYPLVGGRLDYLDNRPVAALVYGHQKHVINLYTWPAPGSPDSNAVFETRQGYNLAHWTQGNMAYWAASDMQLDELQAFVRLLRSPVAPSATPTTTAP